MSRILRRPMFRGGPVDSRGTGLHLVMINGGRVGLREVDSLVIQVIYIY